MSITQIKTIHFKIVDIASINRIMDQRGTVHVEVIFRFIESERFDMPEYIYDGEYTTKWSSSFDENEPYFLFDELQDEIIALLKTSHYDERDAFDLDEKRLYDLSHFEKYDIKYMISHEYKSGLTDVLDEAKIISLATKLANGESVEFVYNALYYEIFESAAEPGYTVNLYSHNEKDEDDDYLAQYLVDGGICSGSSRDAIEFML